MSSFRPTYRSFLFLLLVGLVIAVASGDTQAQQDSPPGKPGSPAADQSLNQLDYRLQNLLGAIQGLESQQKELKRTLASVTKAKKRL